MFFVTAALGAPALVALLQIRPGDIDITRSHGGPTTRLANVADALAFAAGHKTIFVFAACVFLFHLANAALLPLIASSLTMRVSAVATPLTAVAMVIPQVIDPVVIVAVQMFDVISAAVLGVLLPLRIADLTHNSGRFNLVQGIVGCATGIGASISTTKAGYLADRFSTYSAFLALDAVAAVGLLAVWLAMPETRPGDARH